MPCRWASVLAAEGEHPPRRILTSARALSVANNQSSGRSAAVARLLWEQDVAGSIPAAPTSFAGVARRSSSGPVIRWPQFDSERRHQHPTM